ncbi:hypothetical protein BH18THE2_BH18THE2_23030 [soil metagenome]
MAKYSKDKAGVELGFIPTERLDSEILNVISSLGYVIKVTKLKDFDSILDKIGLSYDSL